MSEYIKREALDKALTTVAANDKDKNRRTWAKAICVLHDLPAADVAPVVRCKDCKHRYNDSWCEYVDDDNFYCANGERKDGDAAGGLASVAETRLQRPILRREDGR